MSSVSQAPRRYLIEFGAAMLLYAVLLVGRGYVVPFVHEPHLVKAVLLSPLLAVLLVILSVYRFYRRTDEYQRTRLMKVIVVFACTGAVMALSWILLSDR